MRRHRLLIRAGKRKHCWRLSPSVSVNGSGLGRLDEHRFFGSSLIFMELKRAITREKAARCIMHVVMRARARVRVCLDASRVCFVSMSSFEFPSRYTKCSWNKRTNFSNIFQTDRKMSCNRTTENILSSNYRVWHVSLLGAEFLSLERTKYSLRVASRSRSDKYSWNKILQYTREF